MTEQFDNRELIIEYLESGCKGGDMGYIGVEIEQFVLDEDGDRVPYIEKHPRAAEPLLFRGRAQRGG